MNPSDHLKYFEEHPQIKQSKKIIWVNGCFDIMHAGHIDMLKYAKSLGQKLIVGLDTDERVRSNKGSSRPVNNLYLRVKFMEAIRYVDEVKTFGSNDELKALIRISNADIIVVGDEYKNGIVIGKELVKNVIFYPKQYGLSTTKLIE
jgi:rfaE bifunctional protein nucleotidyltransferase chain/domain